VRRAHLPSLDVCSPFSMGTTMVSSLPSTVRPLPSASASWRCGSVVCSCVWRCLGEVADQNQAHPWSMLTPVAARWPSSMAAAGKRDRSPEGKSLHAHGQPLSTRADRGAASGRRLGATVVDLVAVVSYSYGSIWPDGIERGER
jgi:hypothetical protein